MTVLSAFLKYVVYPILTIQLTLYALALLLPASLASGHPKRLFNFFARAFAFIWSLILCAAYGLTCSILFRIAGKPGLAQWATARAFKYVMAVTCQVWMEVEDEHGELSTRPMVLVGNHQTYVGPESEKGDVML
jgi:lysophosphatidate acyltransferase